MAADLNRRPLPRPLYTTPPAARRPAWQSPSDGPGQRLRTAPGTRCPRPAAAPLPGGGCGSQAGARRCRRWRWRGPGPGRRGRCPRPPSDLGPDRAQHGDRRVPTGAVRDRVHHPVVRPTPPGRWSPGRPRAAPRDGPGARRRPRCRGPAGPGLWSGSASCRVAPKRSSGIRRPLARRPATCCCAAGCRLHRQRRPGTAGGGVVGGGQSGQPATRASPGPTPAPAGPATARRRYTGGAPARRPGARPAGAACARGPGRAGGGRSLRAQGGLRWPWPRRRRTWRCR